MATANTNDILNRLLIVHNRSLAMYISYAAPFWHRGDEGAKEALQIISSDQQRTVDRIGEFIVENNGAVDYGEFPMYFTGYHDLSVSFIVGKLIELQKRDIDTITQCIDDLNLNPSAKAIAEETLGAAKGHLETLQELRAPAKAV